jgi:hypothetical protein
MKIISPKLKITFDRRREIRDNAKPPEPGYHGSSTIMAGNQIASRSRKSSSKSQGASISGIVAPKNTAPRRSMQPPLPVIIPKNAEKDDDDGNSSGNSDDGLGLLWDNTVTSDGTDSDYLTDSQSPQQSSTDFKPLTKKLISVTPEPMLPSWHKNQAKRSSNPLKGSLIISQPIPSSSFPQSYTYTTMTSTTNTQSIKQRLAHMP